MGNQVRLEEYPLQGVVVRESTWDDCRILAPILRDADLLEIKAATGLPAYKALCRSYACSNTLLTVDYQGVPALIMGVSKDDDRPKVGWVWAMGSDQLIHFAKLFIRESKKWLSTLCKGYTSVKNYTHVDNRVHHRWLEHLGFEMSGPYPYGPEGDLFYLIEKEF